MTVWSIPLRLMGSGSCPVGRSGMLATRALIGADWAGLSVLKLKSKPDSREVKSSRELLALERNQALALLAAFVPIQPPPWLHISRAARLECRPAAQRRARARHAAPPHPWTLDCGRRANRWQARVPQP